MSEYIVNIPSILNRDGVYYPDERNDPMPVYEEIVRCRDCNSASFDEFGGGWCNENCREIKAWNFCAWGARREP